MRTCRNDLRAVDRRRVVGCRVVIRPHVRVHIEVGAEASRRHPAETAAKRGREGGPEFVAASVTGGPKIRHQRRTGPKYGMRLCQARSPVKLSPKLKSSIVNPAFCVPIVRKDSGEFGLMTER